MKKKRDIKLIAIDLDGTLLDSNGKLPPRGSRLIKQILDRGIHVIIASTRNFNFIKRICETLKINDALICTNGAYIFESPTGPVWRRLTIPFHIAERICQAADENGWELGTSVGDTTYFKQRPGQDLGPLKRDIKIVKWNKNALLDEPHRILTSQPDAIIPLQEFCMNEFNGEIRIDIFYKPSGDLHSLCLFAKGADKGNALKFVISKLNIPTNQVMAIGDNNNDLPMFEFAEYKVAMQNGTDDMKQAADIIAPSNEREGVAWVLENFIQ